MTIIFIFFILSFLFALVITPLMRDMAVRKGLVDLPSERKVHAIPMPRVGGVALYLSFIIPFSAAVWFNIIATDIEVPEKRLFFLLLGASLVFGIGLWDDLKRLSPWVKLAVQCLGAIVACCLGDICIQGVAMPWGGVLRLGWMSLPVTVFWFVIIINAINLMDGLDGLSAGVVFFASLVLMLLSFMGGNYIVALGLAALAGATLGFLRYNFNPASVFMGDSGSYFLGYMLAALSIMGSIKGQTAVALLIPVVALGLPIFDTLLAPVRRFIRGRSMFRPDSGHIHHRLLSLGMTTRKAVVICYAATVVLGLTALYMVHTTSERAGLLLLLLGVVAVVVVRKLGYFDYVTSEKIIGWFRDVTDEAGFSQERRSFLDIQIAIGKAESVPELWGQTCRALIKMKIDQAEMHFNGHETLHWTSKGYDPHAACTDFLMRVELPLLNAEKHQPYGKLILYKDLNREPLSHYTLRRMEHLRRSITAALGK